MRIDRIDLYRVAMPLLSPWRTAYGEDAVIESVLVKMSSAGVIGWGEASPLAACDLGQMDLHHLLPKHGSSRSPLRSMAWNRVP